MAEFRRFVGRIWPAGLVLLGTALLVAAGFAGLAGPPRILAATVPGLALVGAGCGFMLRRLLRADASAAEQRRRAALFAGIGGNLMRVRDPVTIAAQGEALARDLLGHDAAAVVALADAELPVLRPGAPQRSLPLRGATGDLLGRIAAMRPPGQPFSAEEAELLAQLARLIAAALDTAGLLAAETRSRAETEQVLDAISDGILVFDPAWRVRHANTAALRLLQRSRSDLTGALFWERFPALTGSEFAERLQEARQRRHDCDFTAIFPPLDTWLEVRCYPFAGGLAIYFRDVTAQRETEERLRQSQRLDALGELTGGIAHDVNNLLTVVLGNFDMLVLSAEERGVTGKPDLELAEAGLRAGGNARQLMHRLLAFSRRQKLSPQLVDVGALLAALEPLLRRSVGEAVALAIVAPEGLWLVLADPSELENALINLAVNARDAMPAGGKLMVEAANVAVDPVYAAMAGLERTGDYVMIAVADTGAGMTREVTEKAFDPFFTTKEPGKGTGLGLSMVYGFAKQSGGYVMIDSEPGHGTIVRLYLPRSAAQLPPPQEPAEAVLGGSEIILLIEDSDLVRTHTEAVLRGLGYCVLAAPDGREGLQQLQAGARPDLLLTNIVLPGGLSGRQVADAAAGLVPGLRVLFTSGHPAGVPRDGAPVWPGVPLISKPFRRSELAARVRSQLAAPPWQPKPRPSLAAGSETR